MELQELAARYRDFCDEQRCHAAEYWDEDGDATFAWVDEHVPEEQHAAFFALVGYPVGF